MSESGWAGAGLSTVDASKTVDSNEFYRYHEDQLVKDMLMQRPNNWLGLGQGQGQRVLRPGNNGLEGVFDY